MFFIKKVCHQYSTYANQGGCIDKHQKICHECVLETVVGQKLKYIQCSPVYQGLTGAEPQRNCKGKKYSKIHYPQIWGKRWALSVIGICMCVCDQDAYADSIADIVDQLLMLRGPPRDIFWPNHNLPSYSLAKGIGVFHTGSARGLSWATIFFKTNGWF